MPLHQEWADQPFKMSDQLFYSGQELARDSWACNMPAYPISPDNFDNVILPFLYSVGLYKTQTIEGCDYLLWFSFMDPAQHPIGTPYFTISRDFRALVNQVVSKPHDALNVTV